MKSDSVAYANEQLTRPIERERKKKTFISINRLRQVRVYIKLYTIGFWFELRHIVERQHEGKPSIGPFLV